MTCYITNNVCVCVCWCVCFIHFTFGEDIRSVWAILKSNCYKISKTWLKMTGLKWLFYSHCSQCHVKWIMIATHWWWKSPLLIRLCACSGLFLYSLQYKSKLLILFPPSLHFLWRLVGWFLNPRHRFLERDKYLLAHFFYNV